MRIVSLVSFCVHLSCNPRKCVPRSWQTREKIFRAVGTSGFNFLHACSLHFDEDGGIYFDSPEFVLASEGQWIDSTGFSAALEDLKMPETNKVGSHSSSRLSFDHLVACV